MNTNTRFGRTTKFKHFKGTTMAKSEMFENLKNLSKSSASECDLIKANIDRVGIPLAGWPLSASCLLMLSSIFQVLVASLLSSRRQRQGGWLMESTPPSSTGCRSVLKIHNNFPPLFLITKSTPLQTGQHPRLWLRPVQHTASCLRPRGRHGQGVGGAWGRTCWTGQIQLFVFFVSNLRLDVRWGRELIKTVVLCPSPMQLILQLMDCRLLCSQACDSFYQF